MMMHLNVIIDKTKLYVSKGWHRYHIDCAYVSDMTRIVEEEDEWKRKGLLCFDEITQG